LLVSASPNQPANSVFLSQNTSTSQPKPAPAPTSEQARFIDKSKDFLYSSFAGSCKQHVGALVSNQSKLHLTLQQETEVFWNEKKRQNHSSFMDIPPDACMKT